MLPVGDREDSGLPPGEDNHSEDGACGGSQLVQIGQKGQGDVENPSCRNPLFYRFVSSLRDAKDRIGKIHRILWEPE